MESAITWDGAIAAIDYLAGHYRDRDRRDRVDAMRQWSDERGAVLERFYHEYGCPVAYVRLNGARLRLCIDVADDGTQFVAANPACYRSHIE